MIHNIKTDVLVIGAGPAGMAAAAAAHDGAADVLVLERDDRTGGILNQCVHNGFGLHYFGEELTGPEYAQRFQDILDKRLIRVLTGAMVLSIKNGGSDGLTVTASSKLGLYKVKSRSVVIATGCRERTRGAIGIPGSRPAGVYTAGAAQRLVNINGYMPGKQVVILGSGDIGLIMARRMTLEGARVSLVAELMPYSSGLTRNIVQCVEDYGIPLEFSTTVIRVHGRKRVEGVTVARVDDKLKPIIETARFIPCDTLLLSVGLIPENELASAAGVLIDRVTGGAIVDEDCETSVPGIFACGNALHVHDLVDFVSKEAERAGAAAARHAATGSAKKTISVAPGSLVSYVVPQMINSGGLRDVDLFFRVRSVVKPASVAIEAYSETGASVLLNKKKQIMTPGEMEHVVINAKKLGGVEGSITVNVKAGE